MGRLSRYRRREQTPGLEPAPERRLGLVAERRNRRSAPWLADPLQVAGRFARSRKDSSAQRHHQLVKPVLTGSRRVDVRSVKVFIDAHYPAGCDVGRTANRPGAAHRKSSQEHRVAACEDPEPWQLAGCDADAFEVFEIAPRA